MKDFFKEIRRRKVSQIAVVYTVIAWVLRELGHTDDAKAALAQLLATDPDIAKNARFNNECWHFASGLKDSLRDGSKNAGLDVV